ncbi:hypothetical protein pb186bvf_012345 [Paramecium bursaria]
MLQDDFESIQKIRKRWGSNPHNQQQSLIRVEPQNQESSFSYPDVFITTHRNQRRINYLYRMQNPRQSIVDYSSDGQYDFSLNKDEKKQQLDSMDNSYQKFKKTANKHMDVTVITKKQSIVYPKINLRIIEKNRKEILQDVLKFGNEQSEMRNKLFRQQAVEKIQREWLEKKYKDYRSRSYVNNAYYSILSVDKHSRERLLEKIRREFPKESRFQQI